MAYVPPQARPVNRYPGEMIVPNLLNRIGTFLGSQGADFMRGLSNAPNPFAGTKFMGVPLFEGHTMTGKTLDESIQDLGPINPKPEPQRFDNTLEGQYQRYFKTPEFDNVFGAGARGKGAPKDAAAMEFLGNQIKAPQKDTNIASMYAAQSGMGRVNEDAIQAMYSDRPDMQAWAKANPMLAQREYLKAEQRRANEMPLAPDNETVMGDLGSRAQMDNPMGQEAYDLIKKRLLDKSSAK